MELFLTKNEVTINGNKIPLTFLTVDWNIPKQEQPPGFKKEDWLLPENVKSVKYVSGSNDNVIVYTNGTQENLKSFEEKYEKYFYNKSNLQHLANVYKQLTLFKPPIALISMWDIFNAPLNERQVLISEFKSERKCDDTLVLQKASSFLDGYKKKELLASDWTQLPDVQASFTKEEKDAWVEYRAKLRTLDEEGPLLEVILPEEP